jgi:chromate transporter
MESIGMNKSVPLLEIAIYFIGVSLMAIGGANAVLPEMHRHFVEIKGWMSSNEFATFVALSQVAPGPNVLIVSLLGWKVAGLAGALVATAGMSVPSALLTFHFSKAWQKFAHARWRNIVQSALGPITVGLILASGYVLTRAADHHWVNYGITALTVLLVMRTKIHPLWVLAAAAVLGALGWV